jgi:hypothetical protein
LLQANNRANQWHFIIAGNAFLSSGWVGFQSELQVCYLCIAGFIALIIKLQL